MPRPENKQDTGSGSYPVASMPSMVRLAQLTPEGWQRTHRTIDGMIVTEFQFRLRPNFGKKLGDKSGDRGTERICGSHLAVAEFSRIYGLRMTHASLQNPPKNKKPTKTTVFNLFFQQKKDMIGIMNS